MQSCANMLRSRVNAFFFFAARLLFCSFLCCSSIAVGAQVNSPTVRIELESIDVDAKRPERRAFGSLQLLAAFHLHSKDHRFGGLSGLSFGTDGRLYAISDRGYWLSAKVTTDANGVLSDLGDWQIAPLLSTAKTPVSGRLRDAEALTRVKDGSFLVGFEGVHRIWRYAAPPATFESVPTPEQTPPALARAPRNGGIEALTELPDGRLLLLTEDLENSDGSTKGWIRENGAWAELSYRAADGFYVTDCAALANGDLLILERRFALLAILSTRVTLVTASSVKPRAKLTGKELLKLEQPLAVENFEGIAVRQSAKGTSILLVSDDNYSPFQQTLLLQFLLPTVSADTLTTHAVP
jgi:hypothetical protein